MELTKYRVYAENMDGQRRHLGDCTGDSVGSGIADLYVGDCDDDEEVVIVAE